MDRTSDIDVRAPALSPALSKYSRSADQIPGPQRQRQDQKVNWEASLRLHAKVPVAFPSQTLGLWSAGP